ncbi:MAG: hypothetical protein ACOYMB_03410 [Patescibacteria group bacterium]
MDNIFEKPGEHHKQPEVLPQKEVIQEKPKSPENSAEQAGSQGAKEDEQNLTTEQIGEIRRKSRPVIKTAAQQREEAIDRILSDGLGDIFVKLPPNKQQEFKVEGEKTVKKINELIEKGKLSLDFLAKLIKKWLSIIPGVNKFFLEQDAKIKADKIMEINKER